MHNSQCTIIINKKTLLFGFKAVSFTLFGFICTYLYIFVSRLGFFKNIDYLFYILKQD